MAALLTAALSLDVSPAGKAVIGLALAGHAAAGFLLCWAARPIASADGAPRLTAERLLLRSLINYRRGWRATMLALTLSTLALAVLAWQQLGPDLAVCCVSAAPPSNVEVAREGDAVPDEGARATLQQWLLQLEGAALRSLLRRVVGYRPTAMKRRSGKQKIARTVGDAAWCSRE